MLCSCTVFDVGIVAFLPSGKIRWKVKAHNMNYYLILITLYK
jgi:hypothetical protein